MDPESDSPNLGHEVQRIVAAALRRKWLILLVAVCGTGAGAVAARFVDPQYEAQTTFWVEAGGVPQEGGPIRTGQLLESYAWIELLKSYQVLDHVVREQKLFLNVGTASDAGLFAGFALQERFRPGKYELRVSKDGDGYSLLSDGVQLDQGRAGDPIGQQVGFHWNPPAHLLTAGRRVEFAVLNPRDVAVQLGQNLTTRMAPQDANFLSVSLIGPDPARITSTLNMLADRYVEVAAQLKRAKLEELTSVLSDQRRYAEQELREVEIALEGFRVQTITLPTDQSAPIAAGLEQTRDPVFGRFFEIRVQREQLREDREALERVLQQATTQGAAYNGLAAIASATEFPALSAALQERNTKVAELRSLRARYTDEHRQVQRASEELATLDREALPNLVRSLITQLEAREADLDDQIESAAQELRQIPPRAIEEARLRRRVEIAGNLHTTLRQRYEEARLAAAATIPDIRVLDRAMIPYEPISDSRPMLILLGLMGGLGLAVGGVVLLDRLDSRVRYPEQITKELGLSVLGMVPTIPAGDEEKAGLRASEALREIRLSLLHAHGAAGPLLLTVSSPESGEGKSFVTFNLAAAFAEQGHRTLVIDGDTRRGRLHHMLQLRRTPGLTDYLVGQAGLEEVIQQTPIPQVSLIGSGTRTRQGPELLGSTKMSQLVHGLRERFSVILVDSPPLGAGVDAYALGTITRNLLLVVRVGQTDRAFAEAKLHLLERLPIRLVGAILNCTPESRLYHNYYYLPGYEVVAEDADSAVTPA